MRLLFGVQKTRDYQPFLSSFNSLVDEAKKKYEVEIAIVENQVLCDCQNILADVFLMGNYDYLILFDDDHSGHTVDMIDALINANAYMATIKTYSRHYPYYSSLMKKVDIDGKIRYVGIEHDSDYCEVDLTGFPFTALRRDLFSKIERPYFRQKQDTGGRTWATDEEFCLRLAQVGIKPVGCFRYCINHMDITPNNVFERRRKDMKGFSGFAYMIKQQRLKMLNKTNSNLHKAEEK